MRPTTNPLLTIDQSGVARQEVRRIPLTWRLCCHSGAGRTARQLETKAGSERPLPRQAAHPHVRFGSRLCENVLTASFLRRSFRKVDAGSENSVAPTTNEEEASKILCVKTQITSFCTAWVRCGCAGRVQRPSAYPSIAGISLHCREPPVRARSRHPALRRCRLVLEVNSIR
jgi:hypothetical protein